MLGNLGNDVEQGPRGEPVILSLPFFLRGANCRAIDGVEGRNNRTDSTGPLEEPHEQEDFEDSANDLWSLFGKQAKSHDEAWAKALKEDMDGVLIFVCTCYSFLARVNVTLILGWFILCCSHRVRRTKNPRFESEPCRPVSLLPESNSLHAWPNIATTRLGGPPDLIQLHSLPDLSFIGV